MKPLSRTCSLAAGLLAVVVAEAALPPGYAGSAVCATCHRATYLEYQKTAMALSSGATAQPSELLSKAKFSDPARQFHYQVARDNGGLSFQFAAASGSLSGRKALPYFVGSGSAARSYLIEDGGYLFEAPVAYYSNGSRWDLAPRYESYPYPFLTRPALPGCLGCHASFLSVVEGTQNRYSLPLFAEGGVACERCHGPGAAHAARRGPIVNPAKLDAARRDSVCSQCHLSGDVRLRAAGADWNTYVPGANFADSVKVFVRASADGGMTVTGHVEKLAQSACKRASGDKLWCGSCHDAHSVPAPAKRVAAFRARCLNCHTAAVCKATKAARSARADDCASCHMPKNAVRDAQHVVFTDHSISRRPSAAVAARADTDLLAFGGMETSPRDVALAYAIAGENARARPLLESLHGAADDAEVLLYLAEIYRNDRRPADAVPLYQRAIALDRTQSGASAGLGTIMMEQSNYAEAIRLWEDALTKNSGLLMVRTNLALAYWRAGDKRAAERHLMKAIRMSPGFAPAAELLKTLR